MDTQSHLQPRKRLVFSQTTRELAGVLNVLKPRVIATSSTDIYHGVWESPHGERVHVAVKEFRALTRRNMQSDPQALRRRLKKRIEREMILWSHTIHPNLHPFLGYHLQPKPRLISPWCQHGNLTDYIKANPGLSRVDKLRLIHQAALGLDHLHSRTPPICHADIKPENVLINDLCEAALSDFGLSRMLQYLGEPSGLTTSETARGTLRYMAGELLQEDKRRPDRESDVYAFGGLILAVMSGKPPFWGQVRDATIILRIIQGPTPKSEEHPNLPPDDDLWNLIRRCWNTDPTARPTMREVLRELWCHISREQFGQGSTLRLVRSAQAGGREHSQMNPDAPTKASQEGISTCDGSNSVRGPSTADVGRKLEFSSRGIRGTFFFF